MFRGLLLLHHRGLFRDTGIVITDLDDSEDEEIDTNDATRSATGISISAALLDCIKRQQTSTPVPLTNTSSTALVLFRPSPPLIASSREAGLVETPERSHLAAPLLPAQDDDAMDIEP